MCRMRSGCRWPHPAVSWSTVMTCGVFGRPHRDDIKGAKSMRHAAHKANKDSVQRTSPSALFRSSRGSHTARAVRAVQAANGDAVALAIDPVFAAKLNEVAR